MIFIHSIRVSVASSAGNLENASRLATKFASLARGWIRSNARSISLWPIKQNENGDELAERHEIARDRRLTRTRSRFACAEMFHGQTTRGFLPLNKVYARTDWRHHLLRDCGVAARAGGAGRSPTFASCLSRGRIRSWTVRVRFHQIRRSDFGHRRAGTDFSTVHDRVGNRP